MAKKAKTDEEVEAKVPKELILFGCGSCPKICQPNAECENRRTIDPPEHFDEEYIRERNKFIDEAVLYADKEVRHDNSEEGKAQWNFAYHTKMNELTAGILPSLLRGGGV